MVQALRGDVADERFGSPVRVGFAEVAGPDDVAAGDSGWSGRAVLVIGRPAVVRRVREHLGGRPR